MQPVAYGGRCSPLLRYCSRIPIEEAGLTVGEKLGSGAFGQVFAAKHKDMPTPLAVKMFDGTFCPIVELWYALLARRP